MKYCPIIHVIFSSSNCNECHGTEVIIVGTSLYLMRSSCLFKIHSFGDVSRSQAWMIVYRGCILLTILTKDYIQDWFDSRRYWKFVNQPPLMFNSKFSVQTYFHSLFCVCIQPQSCGGLKLWFSFPQMDCLQG